MVVSASITYSHSTANAIQTNAILCSAPSVTVHQKRQNSRSPIIRLNNNINHAKHLPPPVVRVPLKSNGDLNHKRGLQTAKTAPFTCHTSTPTNACADPNDHSKRQLHQYTHFHTTIHQTSHWLQWDAPNSPPKTVPYPSTITTKI